MGSYNMQVLKYNGYTQYRIYERSIITENEKEANEEKDNETNEEYKELDDEIRKNRSAKVSLNRTKQSIYEIAQCNNWEWFVTLTFDKNKFENRNVYEECARYCSQKLQNMKKRKYKDLKYLFILEKHVKGGFHIHALLSGIPDSEFVDSGRVLINKKTYQRTEKNKNCPWVYHFETWQKNVGFTSCTKVVNSAKCVSYMCKYITKDLVIHAKNKQRYFYSRNLERCKKEKMNVPREEIESMILNYYMENRVDYEKTMVIPEANQKIRFITIKNE